MLSTVCACIALFCLLLVVVALLGSILFTGLLLWAALRGHQLRKSQAVEGSNDAGNAGAPATSRSG